MSFAVVNNIPDSAGKTKNIDKSPSKIVILGNKKKKNDKWACEIAGEVVNSTRKIAGEMSKTRNKIAGDFGTKNVTY